MPKKTKTRDEVVATQDKAVRFLRDVVGDPDKAEEFAAMSPEEYADHKRITILQNPVSGRTTILIQGETYMPKPTRADLEDRISELEDENQALNDKLDSILDIAAEDSDEGDEDDNGDDDQD